MITGTKYLAIGNWKSVTAFKIRVKPFLLTLPFNAVSYCDHCILHLDLPFTLSVFSWSTDWSRSTVSVVSWRRAGGNWKVTADLHRRAWEKWRRTGVDWKTSSKGQRHTHTSVIDAVHDECYCKLAKQNRASHLAKLFSAYTAKNSLEADIKFLC